MKAHRNAPTKNEGLSRCPDSESSILLSLIRRLCMKYLIDYY